MTDFKVAILINGEWVIEREGVTQDSAIRYAAYRNLHGQPSRSLYPEEGHRMKKIKD